MASRRVTRHVIRDCQETIMWDGKVRPVGVGMALLEVTRDAHGSSIQMEMLDRQYADENVRWRRHLIPNDPEAKTWQRPS